MKMEMLDLVKDRRNQKERIQREFEILRKSKNSGEEERLVLENKVKDLEDTLQSQAVTIEGAVKNIELVSDKVDTMGRDKVKMEEKLTEVTEALEVSKARTESLWLILKDHNTKFRYTVLEEIRKRCSESNERMGTLELEVRRLVEKGNMDHDMLGSYMMSAVGNILTQGMQAMRTTSFAAGEGREGESSMPMTHGPDLEKEAREMEVLDDHQDEVTGLLNEHGSVMVTVKEIPHIQNDQMYLDETAGFGPTSSPLILEQVTE
jgi:hypothetical protein